MAALRSLLLLAAVATVQTTLGPLWTPLGQFDLLLIAAVHLALRSEFHGALLIGGAAGLLQDGLSGGVLGMHAFAKVAVTGSVAALGAALIVRDVLAEGLLIGAATVVESTIVTLLAAFLGRPTNVTIPAILLRGVATALFAIFFFVAWNAFQARWQRWRGRLPSLHR